MSQELSSPDETSESWEEGHGFDSTPCFKAVMIRYRTESINKRAANNNHTAPDWQPDQAAKEKSKTFKEIYNSQKLRKFNYKN